MTDAGLPRVALALDSAGLACSVAVSLGGEVVAEIPEIGEDARLGAVQAGANRIVDRDVMAGKGKHLRDAVTHEPRANDGDAHLRHHHPAV